MYTAHQASTLSLVYTTRYSQHRVTNRTESGGLLQLMYHACYGHNFCIDQIIILIYLFT